jgi:hypothetical protein
MTIFELEQMPVARATSREQSGDDNQAGTPPALRCGAPIASTPRHGMAPVLSFARPTDEDFDQLPASERRAILEHLEICRRVLTSPVMSQAIAREARLQGGKDGMSPERIKKRALAFRKSGGDWRSLWNRRNTPSPDARESLPFKFREFVAALRTRFQRQGGDAAAFRLVKRIWRQHLAEIDLEINGKSIKAGTIINSLPGYADWPEADAVTGEPRGWSDDNLDRRCRPDEFTTAVLRRGRSAAAEFRPKVGTTREGLKYAQLYYFDDQQFDEHVNFLGVARKAMRPWGLDCLEALSACHVANLIKPNLYDDVERVKQRIRQVDMLWFAVHVLMHEGYRTDTGTILAGELGTAHLPETIARALQTATDGKVVFDGGGSDGAPPFAGMFEGKGGGNPRHKSPLESIRNLLRNEMSALPGATGLDRNQSPETNVPDKGGQFKYNTTLLKACEALPEEQRQRLRFPFMDYHHFAQLAIYFTNVIDRREDHDLKHWHRCGFVVEAWRCLSHATGAAQYSEWRAMESFLALPADQQAFYREQFRQHPELTATRRLSPWQVRQMLRRDPNIRKLKPSVLPEIFGLEGQFSREVTVTSDNCIEIRDREIDPEPLVFHACVKSRFDADEWLPRGMTFFGFLDHISGQLYLFDQREQRRGAYVGVCQLAEDAPLANRDALARACGKMAAIEKEFLAPVARLGGSIARQNLEMRRDNAEVLAEAQTGLNATERRQMNNRAPRPSPFAPRTKAQIEKQNRRLEEQAAAARALRDDT